MVLSRKHAVKFSWVWSFCALFYTFIRVCTSWRLKLSIQSSFKRSVCLKRGLGVKRLTNRTREYCALHNNRWLPTSDSRVIWNTYPPAHGLNRYEKVPGCVCASTNAIDYGSTASKNTFSAFVLRRGAPNFAHYSVSDRLWIHAQQLVTAYTWIPWLWLHARTTAVSPFQLLSKDTSFSHHNGKESMFWDGRFAAFQRISVLLGRMLFRGFRYDPSSEIEVGFVWYVVKTVDMFTVGTNKCATESSSMLNQWLRNNIITCAIPTSKYSLRGGGRPKLLKIQN